MVVLTLLAFVFSFIGSVWVLRMRHRHAAAYGTDLPQRFHQGAVPRLGGVAIAGAMALAWLLGTALDGSVLPLNLRIGWRDVMMWLLVLTPAVVTGVVEDLTQRLPVRYRLALTAASGGLACLLLGIAVTRLGLPFIDPVLAAFPMLGVVLAVVAVAGLPHAFNIIDGYNGLAGTVALLVCLAIAHVALQVGDRSLAAFLMCLAGATTGFLVWNYPRGLIFAGDGGAYLWGVVIAVACVLLVQRHPQVSPWFPVLLLIYPVWETVFSIYRKTARGGSPGMADALHFHQLIFRRIVRQVLHDDEARQLLSRNNRTSPYLWGFTLVTVVPAVVFWQNTPVLIGFSLLFVVTYVGAYLAIVRFKVPGWIQR